MGPSPSRMVAAFVPSGETHSQPGYTGGIRQWQGHRAEEPPVGTSQTSVSPVGSAVTRRLPLSPGACAADLLRSGRVCMDRMNGARSRIDEQEVGRRTSRSRSPRASATCVAASPLTLSVSTAPSRRRPVMSSVTTAPSAPEGGQRRAVGRPLGRDETAPLDVVPLRQPCPIGAPDQDRGVVDRRRSASRRARTPRPVVRAMLRCSS